jgi:hypothetical protein
MVSQTEIGGNGKSSFAEVQNSRNAIDEDLIATLVARVLARTEAPRERLPSSTIYREQVIRHVAVRHKFTAAQVAEMLSISPTWAGRYAARAGLDRDEKYRSPTTGRYSRAAVVAIRYEMERARRLRRK